MANHAHPEVLVDTDWVTVHAKDPNVRVVEVDVDTKAYDEGHVPAALAWAWNTRLCDTVVRDICRRRNYGIDDAVGHRQRDDCPLIRRQQQLVRRLALWQRKIYGHQDVRIVNGGRKKWRSEARELDATPRQATPSTRPYQASGPDYSLRAFLPQVQRAQKAGNTILIASAARRNFRARFSHLLGLSPIAGSASGRVTPGSCSSIR